MSWLMFGSLQRWIRTSDALVPRVVRSVRRFIARRAAERSHGSVANAMDAVVERAHASGGAAPRRRSPGPAARPTGAAHTVVAVSSYPVSPRQSGGQLRAWHLLTRLAAGGDVEVRIVSTRTDGPPRARSALRPMVTEDSVRLTDEQTRAETELRLLTGHVSITDIALSCLWPMTPDLTDALVAALDGADTVIHVQPYLATAIETLAPGIAAVCDEHNHESALKAGILPENDGGRWLLDRVVDTEGLAIRQSRLVTATTDADLASIRADFGIGQRAAAVVPNGVDTSAIPFITGTQRRDAAARLRTRFEVEQRGVAVFVGSGHLPNIRAGRTIVELAPEAPDTCFLLAGRHSESLGGLRLPPNVKLLGAVSDDDLTLLLSGADVALNPMASGGGSNLKLMTYLASGVPVVSTPVGARGLAAADAGIVVAELDEQIAAMRRASVGADERAAAGRSYVVRNCDWGAIGSRFSALLHEHVWRRP